MSHTPPTIERLSAGRAECIVTFPAEESAKAEEKAIRELGKEVKIDGFRPGMAPLEKLKERIAEERVFEETVRHLLFDMMPKIVQEHQLQPIIPPKVEAVSREPVSVKVTFVEKPQVTVKGADKLTVKRKEITVEKKEIDRMIDYVLGQNRTITPVDRPAAEKDRVTIDLWAEDEEGKEVDGARLEGRAVVIGGKELIPGFEEELVGLKIGDQKSFTLTFPEKYQAEHLRGKKATFHVTVRAIEEVQMPELTDDYAKEQFQAPSAEEFRKRVEASMREQEERVEQSRREQELLEVIRKATVVELAPELIEEEQRALLTELSKQLSEQNLTFEQWLKKGNRKAEDVLKEFEDRAKQRLMVRFGIEYLLDARGITMEEQEMTNAVQEFLTPLSPEERTTVEPNYRPGRNAYEQLRWQKRVEKLMEQMLAT